MSSNHNYFVYILSNSSRTLYVGMTNDIDRRLAEHKSKLVDGFTKRYNITKLVYFEQFSDVHQTILREKQIKGWVRKRKIDLITAMNPTWQDLSISWNSAVIESEYHSESADSSLRSE